MCYHSGNGRFLTGYERFIKGQPVNGWPFLLACVNPEGSLPRCRLQKS